MDKMIDCPICTNEVMNLTPRNYKGLVVECSRCGIYRVMEPAVVPLHSLKAQQRLAALAMAKKQASGNSVPTISSACLYFSRRSSNDPGNRMTDYQTLALVRRVRSRSPSP